MPEVGTVVATHRVGHQEIIMRYPKPGDAPAMLEYINQLSREQTFVTMQGEQLTLAQEERWLQDMLQDLEEQNVVALVAEVDQRIVGIATVTRLPRVESHVAELAISVAADYRDNGLGSQMFMLINQQADQHLPGLKIVMLAVFGPNLRAQHVYQKHGFQIYGRLPQGVRYQGQLVDQVYMYRSIDG